ncbi:hypothetical protein AB0N31_03680 [Streptomyces sp. NPDC051051]|uniref:hypothetical protein n=1 Tax=Streptomyces sp. NPDC051051 TaxID=3155666 RepID=UPI0034364E7F
MSSDSDSGSDEGGDDGHGGGTRNRRELLWRIGIAIFFMALIVFFVSIYEDPGPVCGTGQDKGPC